MKGTSFKPGISRLNSKKTYGTELRKTPTLDPAKRNLSMRSTQQYSTFRDYSVESKQQRHDKSNEIELFGQTSKRLKTLRGDHRHSLQNELDNILEIVNKEKVFIQQNVDKANQKAEKYKALYMEQQTKNKSKAEYSVQGEELYGKFVAILKQMNINPANVLPQREKGQGQGEGQTTGEIDGQGEFKEMSKDQIIRVQRFLIKKLIKKLEGE